MIMRRILCVAALFAVLVLPLSAKTVKGTVSGEGNPLSGVIVSDGYTFAKTDAKGKFSLPLSKSARYVFVITPDGYVGDFSSGAPQFYLPVKGTKAFNFNLKAFPSKGGDYTLFSVSDPQMQNEKHLQRFKGKPLGDLRGMAARYSAERPTVGIALGDIAWNRLEMHAEYKKLIATTGIPFYGVIGNHDFIQTRSGVEAGEAYEAAFGPYNYAFFLGKDLVIGLNDIIFAASGKDDPAQSSQKYREGYSQEALGFVRGLLKLIPKGTHLYIAQHSPIRMDTKGFKMRNIEGADEMLSILEGYEVDILSGHTHYMNRVKVNGHVTDHNAAAIGGAWWDTDLCRDGTPRGYEIISSVGGKVSWNWHSLDIPDDVEVEFIGMDKSPLHRNSVVAHAWYADSSWTAEWYEDGVYAGKAEWARDYSDAYDKEIVAAWGDPDKVPGYKRPHIARSYFVATPSQYADIVKMVVKAPDGRTWSHEFDVRGSYIDLQAHRGGAGLMPENTITSMRHALDLNVNTLEFDLHISGDGKVVVSHDRYFHPRYSTRPDGSLVQKSDPKEYLYLMPYDSIAKYDVGLRHVDVWPDQFKVAEHKPLASDLIDFVENYTKSEGLSPVRYNIEIKSSVGKGEGKQWPEYHEFCDKCMEVLLSKNLGDRLVVQCFDVRALNYLHRKYPEVHLSYLTDKEPEIADLLALLEFKPTWWSPNYSVVTPENVAYCHALGIRVVPWTVDDPAEIRRMADCGVDAIISNYPDRLIKELR